MKRTPLRRVSKKLSAALRIYSAQRKKFLIAHPFCQVEFAETGRKVTATDIHHTAGRGPNLNNESTWLAVCREMHERIHRFPSWARSKGYLK